MTPFSFVLFGIIGYFFIRSRKWKDYFISFFGLTVAIEMNSISGYFLLIGDREISYSDVALLITTVIAIFVIFSRKQTRKSATLVAVTFVVITLLGMLLCTLIPPKTTIVSYGTSWENLLYGLSAKTIPSITIQSYLMFFKLICFLLIALAAISIKPQKNTIMQMSTPALFLLRVHICYALIEIVTKNILRTNAVTEIRNALFGVGSSTCTELLMRGASSAIYGMTKEPSHLSTVMCLFIIICILLDVVKRERVWILLAMLVMLFSMSFSTLMYLACIGILYIAINRIRVSKRTLLFSALGVCAVVFIIWYVLSRNQYYLERVTGLVEDLSLIFSGGRVSQGGITSSFARMYSLTDTFMSFIHRPLLGIGIGTAYCHSGVVAILANIGIIGFIMWLRFLFCECSVKKNKFFSKRSKCLAIAILLPNIVCGDFGILYVTYYLLFCFGMDYRLLDAPKRMSEMTYEKNIIS